MLPAAAAVQSSRPDPNKCVDYSRAPALRARWTCRNNSAVNVQRPRACAQANCSNHAPERKRTRASKWARAAGSRKHWPKYVQIRANTVKYLLYLCILTCQYMILTCRITYVQGRILHVSSKYLQVFLSEYCKVHQFVFEKNTCTIRTNRIIGVSREGAIAVSITLSLKKRDSLMSQVHQQKLMNNNDSRIMKLMIFCEIKIMKNNESKNDLKTNAKYCK